MALPLAPRPPAAAPPPIGPRPLAAAPSLVGPRPPRHQSAPSLPAACWPPAGTSLRPLVGLPAGPRPSPLLRPSLLLPVGTSACRRKLPLRPPQLPPGPAPALSPGHHGLPLLKTTAQLSRHPTTGEPPICHRSTAPWPPPPE
ncbi:uncharacterized protein LOC131060284 [Cryptomeria japonica]|uniref:uncharacterized protein LOC131060284 n=1 Tax=Cryptomeria japonica TaxID=3369 RepID=UPI0025AC76EB|nr:uncharacterized protein LOC131060284 [Cryptomeria japonica]